MYKAPGPTEHNKQQAEWVVESNQPVLKAHNTAQLGITPLSSICAIEQIVIYDLQVSNLDTEGFFTLMNDKGELRSDLRMTTVCNLQDHEDFIKMEEKAEADHNVVIVSFKSLILFL